jgi:hypothetical protein
MEWRLQITGAAMKSRSGDSLTMSVKAIDTLTNLKKSFGRFHEVVPAYWLGILLFMGLPMSTRNMDLLIAFHISLTALILPALKGHGAYILSTLNPVSSR